MADRRSGAVNLRKTNRGVLLGEFEVGSEIGKGSFAQVYLGTQQATGAAVAIKSVELSRLNKKLKENLYSEIRILKKLRHPHIVALHDCLESSTHINLVMEYCELGDLSLFIKKREKHFTNPAVADLARKYPPVPHAGLNEVVIRHFLQQLASALKFLRESNFVHRDVKPQNLLLLPSPGYREAHRQGPPILSASHDSLIPAAGLRSLPMLKLADFGFARVLPSTALAETLCGSPLYMAPEILRYEKYDAKADLWSVGTVLYEMVSGRPPFRASNHVELLRKIENTDDQIKFPREVQVSSELKSLIRALLKRNPVERLSFENFFSHYVVTSSIPGLVEDDVPKVERPSSSIRQISRTDEPPQAPLSGRRLSMRRYQTDNDTSRDEAGPSSPREKPLRSSPLASPGEFRPAQSPREDLAPGLGIRRPVPQSSTSAPNRPSLYDAARRRGLSNASATNYIKEESSLVSSSLGNDAARRTRTKGDRPTLDEQEKTAQDLAFEREYVVVEKKHVEVNALADELAAKGMQQASSPKSGQMVRRATQQGVPTSTTGAVPAYPSNALQVAQGKQRPDHNRRPSYDKMLSGSPNSTTSVISKAIQDASLRLFGVKYPTHLLGKGSSPPHMYNPFPAYPTPAPTAGMITDGRSSGPMDEDQRVANCIEDYATRSDVVWGFAEVKYKQLVPMTPSMDHGLGGAPADSEDDDGLTVEAVVVLSEEALVLYVKALSLLAKSMDIASIWWARRARGESTGSSAVASRDPIQSQNLINRVNSAVQWVRKRFNETLEKADVVRLRLVAAQEKLPEEHPSHPSRNRLDQISLGTSGADGIVLTAGLSAEKLMYERAVEMSRTAAINEIANEDLAECQISYITAIRLLEAVLDNDDDVPKRRSSNTKVERETSSDEPSEINSDDQLAVKKMISMIKTRLNSLKKKIDMIEAASKAQQKHEQIISRKRSGDVTPRSVPAHLS